MFSGNTKQNEQYVDLFCFLLELNIKQQIHTAQFNFVKCTIDCIVVIFDRTKWVSTSCLECQFTL